MYISVMDAPNCQILYGYYPKLCLQPQNSGVSVNEWLSLFYSLLERGYINGVVLSVNGSVSVPKNMKALEY